MKRKAEILLSALLLFSAFFFFGGCTEETVGVPENLQITMTKNDFVELSWEASENANRYRIFKRQDAQTEFKFIDEVEELRYVDSSIENGHRYFYKVQAFGEAGFSERTAAISVEIPPLPYPDD